MKTMINIKQGGAVKRLTALPALVVFILQIQVLVLLQLQLTQMISLTCLSPVEAAHARKRPTVSTKKSNSNNKYDRQITTFDPNGRLLQVEYARECTLRGKTCAFVNYENDIIVAKGMLCFFIFIQSMVDI